MKLHVFVKPNSRQEKVEKIDEKTLKVWVNAPPIEGKANAAVIHLLSKYLSIPKRSIRLVSGEKGKHKVIEI